MRVLHVINSLGGSGGAENGLVREITRFDPSVEQLVLRLFEQDDLGATLDDRGVEVVHIGLAGSAAARNWPVAVSRTRNWIRDYNPDVVHTSLFTANMVGQMAARSMKVPVLSTITQSGDVDLVRSYQPGASTTRASMLRALAARSARSPYVRFRGLTNHATTTTLRSLGVPADRARVIPRGVEVEAPARDPDVRSRLGLTPDAQLIVNVGRQAAQKGHLLLIEAFERLAAWSPRAHLVVLGREGDATEQTRRRLASSPVASRVHFLGFRRDTQSILRAADVFMFSSLMEGLGTAVLEAMAAGAAVVAFDIPPVREISDDGRVAYLVPVGDAALLAEATQSVLAGAVPDLTDRARIRIRENYDIRVVAAMLQSYLESVINSI